MPTPTKISPRKQVCRDYGDSHVSFHMFKTFSKAGSPKDLCAEVYKTCGKKISEDNTRSKFLCQGSVTFANKMEQFMRTAQSMESMPMRSTLTFTASITITIKIYYL